MSPRPALVVVGSGAAQAYREYALRSISRRYDVVLVDEEPPTWQLPYVVDSETVDLTDDSSVAKGIDALAGRVELAGIMSWDERRLQVTAANAARLGLAHNSPETVAACRDKLRSRQIFAQTGVPSAQSVQVSSLEECRAAAEHIGLPVVLKPRSLAGSIGVTKVSVRDELEAAWATASGASMPGVPDSGGVLVEEYLDGPEVSVECVSFGGTTSVVAVTRKQLGLAPYFEELGHVVEAADPLTSPGSPVVTAALQAVAALGVTTGISHVELRLTRSGPRLIEVNARLGGDMIPHLVHLATGTDLSLAAADVAVGRAPDLSGDLTRTAAITFFYPHVDGVIDVLEVDPALRDEPWLEQVTWVRPVGATMLLPPRAFMGRIGFAVVVGDDPGRCADLVAEVERRVEIGITPEERPLVAVLSTLNPVLERQLAARGERVLAIVPAGAAPVDAPYDVLEVEQWDDFTRLAGLARRLELAGVARVVTADERCLRAAGFLRDLLGLGGQSLRAATAFTDKSTMKRLLHAAGVPVARHRLVHEIAEIEGAADALGWPVVVKPRFGFSAINTLRIEDRAHLETLHATGGLVRHHAGPVVPGLSASSVLQPLGEDPCGFVVEACVDVAAEYHCELLVHEGEEVYCLPFRYPTPLLQTAEGGVGSAHVPLGSDEAERVQELTWAAARALGLSDGFAHAEVFRTTGGSWVLGEISSRPGGAKAPHALRLQYGVELGPLLADQAMGLSPRVDLRPRADSVAWRSMPAPRGRIVEMTSAEELRALPGVVDVVMDLSVGEVSSGGLGSLCFAASVFCAAGTPQEAEHLAASAAAAFSVRVEEEG